MKTAIWRHSVKGRAVHATLDLKEGEWIETNHVIVYTPIESKDHELNEYGMEWRDDKEAIALGNINLLNHSESPNVMLTNDYGNMTKSIYAKRDIKLGEELTLDYDCELWFDVAE